MGCSLVIFDCDGVLVDTRAIECEVFSEVMAGLGITITPEDVDRHSSGMTDDEAWRAFGGLFAREFSQATKDLYWANVTTAWRTRMAPIPGVEQVLQSLLAAGVPMCVASGGTLAQLAVTLPAAELQDFFGDHVFSTVQAGRNKPAPDVYLFAASKMGVAPEACVVVEDGVNGARAGLAAGMRVLGYAPEGSKQDLADLGIETFAHMSELPLLLGLGSLNTTQSGRQQK